MIYNELGTDATADYTRRNDVLTLQFVADPDWATLFKAADGEYHGQEKFGDLIEQAGHLITSHPAAEVVEIVDSIQSSSNGSFKSQIKRDTGSQHLTYSEEVTASAGTATRPLEVPRDHARCAAVRGLPADRGDVPAAPARESGAAVPGVVPQAV